MIINTTISILAVLVLLYSIALLLTDKIVPSKLVSEETSNFGLRLAN